ncbi:HNH endonuclease, partial [Candidatus Phycosocius spiralis]|uniref:HNH endonuclease n=1 Tax=Candidatus Phycosocius spiralis TaxID=2815099 RepID=UPI0024E12DDA
LGDVTPSTPETPQAPQATPPKKKKCGGLGQILLVVIAVVVTIATKGATKEFFLQVFAKMGASAAAAATAASYATAAAIGSTVSQAFGVATGIQEKFDWKAVALAFITNAVSGGMAGKFGSGILGAVLENVAANATTQAIAVTMGLQDKFSWAAVAAAGVGGGVGHGVGNSSILRSASAQTTKQVVSMATAVANAATRSLIDGSDFGDNVMAALPSVVGNMIVDGLASLNFNGGGDKLTQLANNTYNSVMTDAAPEVIKVYANKQAPKTKWDIFRENYEQDLYNLNSAIKNGIRIGNTRTENPRAPSSVQTVFARMNNSSFARMNNPSFARMNNPSPNQFGTLGNIFAPKLNDPFNAKGAFSAFKSRLNAAMRGGDPFERGIAASGLSQSALGSGLSAMIPDMQGAAVDMMGQTILGEGVGALVGRVAGLGGRVLGGEGGVAKSVGGSLIPKIGGKPPINNKYAGQVHPSGVRFTEQGFPDFRPYAKAEVGVEGLTGVHRTDAALANAAVGLKSTPKGYVWHHVEDGFTMQLIPKATHNSVRHTGGAAVIRNGGFD